MAPRRKASIIASSKPPYYDPRDLCHPEEIDAIEAECEEDDKTVEEQDLEVGFFSLTVQERCYNMTLALQNCDSEFSPSQNSSQETDLTSSQSTVHYVDSEDSESQYTYSQSSQCYEEYDAGDDFAEYRPPQIITTRLEQASVKKSAYDESLTEGNSIVQDEGHDNNNESWSFNSSSPFEPNFPLNSGNPEK